MAQPEENKKPRSLTLPFVILLGISALMYVSFVYKVIKFGP